MHKAVKQMTEAMSDIDLVIELLDARLPYSSHNPSITQLRGSKPYIMIFSKSDLADPGVTKRWQSHFEQEESVTTLLTSLDDKEKAHRVVRLCKKLVASDNINAMITGIPNVGKSTLINTLAGRKIAKTGDEPAITKGLQRIKLDSGIMLFDTPGILWPKIHNENSGFRLAATGAIKSTAMDSVDVAAYLGEFLLKHYPDTLRNRYQIESLPASEIELLEIIGAKRGTLRAGGKVDFENVSSILVNEFRLGKLGRVSLETPEMIPAEEAVVEAARLEKIERDKLRKKKWRDSA